MKLVVPSTPMRIPGRRCRSCLGHGHVCLDLRLGHHAERLHDAIDLGFGERRPQGFRQVPGRSFDGDLRHHHRCHTAKGRRVADSANTQPFVVRRDAATATAALVIRAGKGEITGQATHLSSALAFHEAHRSAAVRTFRSSPSMACYACLGQLPHDRSAQQPQQSLDRLLHRVHVLLDDPIRLALRPSPCDVPDLVRDQCDQVLVIAAKAGYLDVGSSPRPT